MEQIKITKERIIQVNYEDANLPIIVRELRPVVFESSGGYCCILGPDERTGIVGSGTTIKSALASWEAELRKRINKPADDDEVALYAVDVLQASNKKVW